MAERKEVQTAISDEIYSSMLPTLTISRILGAAPIKIVQSHPNKYHLQWSRKYCLYSYLLGATIGGAAIVGIINDVQKGKEYSVKMKTNKSKIVTGCDVLIIVLISMVGVFGSAFRMKSYRTFIKNLSKVDTILPSGDTKQGRMSVLIFLSALYITMTSLLLFDGYMWCDIANKTGTCGLFMRNYIPFYCCYYIVMTLEVQYWHAAFAIKRRLRHLNTFLNSDKFDTNNGKIYSIKIGSTINNKNVRVQHLPSKNHKLSDLILLHNQGEMCARRNLNLRNNLLDDDKLLFGIGEKKIMKLCEAHGCLCNAVRAINDNFGIIVTIILISCLLHLIVTPYFLVLGLSTSQDVKFLTIQLVWIMAHFARLLIVIEPCDSASVEAKKTKALICEMLRSDIDHVSRKQLKIFSLQLLHQKVEFSASGLCPLNRSLVTSIAAAVTTYLVILIQYQED